MLKKISFFITLLLISGMVLIFEEVPLEATINNPENNTKAHILSEEKVSNKKDLITNNEDVVQKVDKESKENEKEDTQKCLTKVNDLSKKELQLIDGIGQVYSTRITKAKDINTIEDLKSIDGIGKSTAEKIENFVCQDLESKLNQLKEKQEKSDGNNEKESKKKVKEEDILELVELINEYKTNKDKPTKDKGKQKPNKVKINSASPKQLERIDGVGPAYSKRIIKHRPFCSLDELTKVKGIGEKTLEGIREQNLATINIKCKDNNSPTKNKKKEDSDNEEKLEKEISSLEREISYLRDDYQEVRGSLMEKRRKVDKYKEKIKTVQKQRDKCRYPNQININKATVDQLKNLSNVGDVRAEKIYKAKEIKTLEELTKIDGIGEATVSNWIKEGVACTWGSKEDDGDNEQEEEGDDEESLEKIEINTAKKKKLLQIHGVGKVTAKNIINHRKDNFFCALTDLKKIKGIGETTLKKIREEDLATIDPPTKCFNKEINITNYPEEITLNEEFSVDVKFLDFKNSNYQLNLKIKGQKPLIEKSKKIKLNEEKESSFSFQIDKDVSNNLNLVVEVKDKESIIATKELSNFAKVKTPESKYLTTFKEVNNLENVNIRLFKDKQLIFKELTNESGLVEKELTPDTYKLKTSRIGYKPKEKKVEVEKGRQINVELVKKEFIKNNSFQNWTEESPDNWKLDNQSHKAEGSQLQLGPHNYKGPYEEVSTFNHPKAEGKTITYKLKARVKGTGYIQLGLVRPGYTNASYSNWKLIDNKTWTTINYEITKKPRENFDPQGEFIIRHTSDKDLAEKESKVEKVNIKVDSVNLEIID